MRGVAQRLGAGTMSLYHHVDDKEDLLGGVLELVVGEVDVPPPDVQDWMERTSWILRSFRTAVLRHPSVLPLVATQQFTTPHALRVAEEALDALHQGGFRGSAAVHAYRSLASYVVGFLSLEIGGVFRLRDNPMLPGLMENPPEDLPRLIEVAPHLFEWDPEHEFVVGLRAILAGLDREARARRQGRARDHESGAWTGVP